MNRILSTLMLVFLTFAAINAQNIEDDIEFKYIKAMYLLDKENYEEAIKAFSEIIREKEDYSDALVKRAKAKYAMAAYKGTKKDILQFAAIKGMPAEAVTLLGLADYKMGNFDAALNSLTTATQFEDPEADLFLYIGNIYEDKDQEKEACYFWRMAAKMGSSKGAIKLKKVCGDVVKAPSKSNMDASSLPTSRETNDSRNENRRGSIKNNKSTSTTTEREKGTLGNPTKDKVLEGQIPDYNTEEPSEEVDPEANADHIGDVDTGKLPMEDNTPNEIVIDKDLTLIIKGQGLGKRRILNQPNILILSDTDGIVAVDICVNKRGKVETAEFNTKISTVAKKSLVSLAIRKAKDFWFEKNDYKEQCGVIMFKIKGS